MFSENILELFLVNRMFPGFFLKAWSLLLTLSWLARRNKVEEVLVSNKFSILIDYCDSGLKVPVVKRIHDGSKHIQSFTLRNDVFFNGTIVLHNLLYFIIDLEIASAHHF